MPHDYSKTAKGESATFWRGELERAYNEWMVKEDVREELRTITSEYELEQQLFPHDDDGPDAPVIDQRDVHIIPRFKDRLVALGGDEKPEVRMPRDLRGFGARGEIISLAKVGGIQDRLAMRVMAMAGAPEEYEDGMAALVTEGITAHWVEMTGLPDAAEEAQARQSPDEIMESAKSGNMEVGRLQDSAEIGAAMGAAGTADPRAAEVDFATHPEGESPTERVIEGAALHIEDAVSEEKGYPFYWRDGRFNLKVTRYPYGKWFRMDSTGFRHKDIRWVARLIPMEIEEARTFPGFRPSVAEKMEVEAFEDPLNTAATTTNASPDDDEDTNDSIVGRAMVWHILDKKWNREYFLPNEVDEFLADRPAPNLDANGRSILRASGRYGGFFPVSLQWGKLPTRNTPQKLLAIPLGMPGLKGQKIVTKDYSYWGHAVKQASSSWTLVSERLLEEHGDDFQRNEGGIIGIPSDTPKESFLMENFGWKPPPAELFAKVRDGEAKVLQDLSFPAVDFALQGQEDTATQERLVNNAGQRDAFEIIRQSEVSYAITAHICMAMVRHNFSDADIDELIGAPDRVELRKVWDAVGQPLELPEVTFAPKSRNRDLARSKMLMDLHERLKVEVDPITGAPTHDGGALLDEALVSLGVGKLPAPELTDEQKVIMAKAKLMAAQEMQAQESGGQPGQPTSGGKTRDTEGKPRGRRERAGRRDSSRGRGRTEREGADLGAASSPGPS